MMRSRSIRQVESNASCHIVAVGDVSIEATCSVDEGHKGDTGCQYASQASHFFWVPHFILKRQYLNRCT